LVKSELVLKGDVADVEGLTGIWVVGFLLCLRSKTKASASQPHLDLVAHQEEPLFSSQHYQTPIHSTSLSQLSGLLISEFKPKLGHP
jgi:hypothetical protein